MIACVVYLIHLSERKHFAEMTEGIDDSQIACGHSLLQRVGNEKVTDEDCNLVVP